MSEQANGQSVEIADEGLKLAFKHACTLLDKVTCIVNGVLETVSPEDVRSVCADEFAVQGEQPSAEPGRDHRKGPRGRVHPLLVLMKLGVQAARLLKQIGGGLNPHLLNIMTRAEKLAAEAQRQRVELEKADRKFTAAWAAMD